jgi:Domain of unknown function (DUF4397)
MPTTRDDVPRLQIVLAALGLLAFACSSTSAGPTGPGGAGGAGATRDAGYDTLATDASDALANTTADAAPDATPDAPPVTDAGAISDAVAPGPPALVRLGHLSPDLPPVDFCLAPHGTTDFQGPLLGDLRHPDGGGDGAVSYGQVGAYLPVAAGRYDLRLVTAGTTSCGPAGGDAGGSVSPAVGVPDATNLPAFAPNTNVTLLVVGDLTPAGSDAALTIEAIPDDAVLAGGAAELRAVNAVPSLPAADFGLGSFAADWLPLFTNVPFGGIPTRAADDEGTVDARGYLSVATLAPQVMSVRASSNAITDVAVAHSFGIDLGSIVTVFAMGGKTGDTTHPPALLVCVDNQPAGGLLSDCSVAP